MANAVDVKKTISFLRPTGLFFNYMQNGFFNASSFIILFLCGKRMFSSILINRLILIILYVGVILATSRQVIFSFHLILIMILFIRPSRFNISSSKYLSLLILCKLYISFNLNA